MKTEHTFKVGDRVRVNHNIVIPINIGVPKKDKVSVV